MANKLTVTFENEFGFKATVSYEGFTEQETLDWLHGDNLQAGLGFKPRKDTQ